MFQLRRYFSITSLVGVVLVVVGLSVFYRYLVFHALLEHETRSNVALTQVFANTLWPKYAPFITGARGLPREELIARPEIEQLRADVVQKMQGLNVVKVKIYDLEGLTVFSTETRQIGEDQSTNAGFRRARAGETASEIAFRERFDNFEQVVVDRDLVYSYIPIRKSETSAVEGVLEVYADVSGLVRDLKTVQWKIAAAVLGILSLLYFFLFLIVRRADDIIRARSEEERRANREKLQHQAFHDALTGLPNRIKFAEHLDEAVARARITGDKFAVLFIDLDQFKYLNDSLGHFMGDRLLQAVGERLTNVASEAYIVARLGGDEFAMLVPDISRISQVSQVAARVRHLIASQPYQVDGRVLGITPSIGISIYPAD